MYTIKTIRTGHWLVLAPLLFTVLLLTVASCKKDEDTTEPLQTIDQLISTNSQFTILRAAVARAGLSGTLSGNGPFTVFAPNDAAFAAAGFNAAAINALDPGVVGAILQYHVLAGRTESGAIPTAVNTSVQTSAGSSAFITKTSSGSVSINGARVVQANVPASNGVVHVIDRILIPSLGNIPAMLTTVSTLFPTATFTILNAAVTRAGLGGALTGAGPLTVFAPTDAAFVSAGFPLSTVQGTAPTALANILTYHVVSARGYSPLLTNGQSLTTLQTGTVTMGVSGTGVTVTGRGNGGTASRVILPDVSATNGVVHVVDRVLLP
ncbi:fasciclin domain-containing protein [Spirosoma montaniterrae]|uniref:FAS1 domain-containing protein n=1 Tax=Spirosoma montaniterrae TaxID=1178516 RepID=A0A1P9WWE0_9BACT|nr:fasciclin domain-containing protein [Spirosoma montaniterrae]AQG79691.1 hypothetical protein AWR27_10340 [Spirosoma montaniterrae]